MKLKFMATKRKAVLVSSSRVEEMRKFFSYYVPGYRFVPSFKARVWDGKVSLMSSSGEISLGLLRGMKEELASSGYTPKLIDWNKRPKVKTIKGITGKDAKYAYQNECVQKMLQSLPFGGGLIISATGTGKTATAAKFMSHIDAPVLFVVDQIDLLYQSQKEIEEWLRKKVGVVGNSHFLPEKYTVATIQTLQRYSKDKKFLKWFKSIQVVIIDEIHVQMNKRNFSLLQKIRPEAVFGLTATLEMKKKDVRMRVYSLCGPVLYSFPVKEAMESGVLTRGIALQCLIPCKVKEKADYDAAVVDNQYLHQKTAEIIREAVKKKYAVVVLVERLKHLDNLREALKPLTPVICAGETKRGDREKSKKKFEDGKANLILATRVFKKGINLKRIDLIVDTAQQSNKNDVLQKFGRGVRLHSAKQGLIYLDIAVASDNLKLKRAASSRLSALKSAGIRTEKMIVEDTARVVPAAASLLQKELGKTK